MSGNLLSSSTAAYRRESAPYPKQADPADRCGAGNRSTLFAGLAFIYPRLSAGYSPSLSGAQTLSGNTRSECRQSAESRSRPSRGLSFMATAAAGTDFLRQVYAGYRQSPVWATAALALRCAAHTGTGSVPEIYPSGGSHCGGQSPVRNASRLALWHARPMATHAADANSLQQARSRVCRSRRRKAAIQSDMALGNFKPVASGLLDRSGKAVITRHTRPVSRSTPVQNNCQLYYPGKGVGTVCHHSAAPNLPAAAGYSRFGRQSAARNAARLALFRTNNLMATRSAASKGVTEDFTGRCRTSYRKRPERKTEMEAQQ